MNRFEYQVTTHSAETLKRVVYFCSEKGECGIQEVPGNEANILVDIMNEQGAEGWELVQLFFGKDGILAVWKKPILYEPTSE